MKTDIKTCIAIDDLIDYSGQTCHDAQQYPVDTIRIGYPVANWWVAEVRSFPFTGQRPATIDSIAAAAAAIIRREVEQGHNYGPHVWSDYVIERVTIADNIATIEVGS